MTDDPGFDAWLRSTEMREAAEDYQRRATEQVLLQRDRGALSVVTDDAEPSRLRPAFTTLTDLLAESRHGEHQPTPTTIAESGRGQEVAGDREHPWPA